MSPCVQASAAGQGKRGKGGGREGHKGRPSPRLLPRFLSTFTVMSVDGAYRKGCQSVNRRQNPRAEQESGSLSSSPAARQWLLPKESCPLVRRRPAQSKCHPLVANPGKVEKESGERAYRPTVTPASSSRTCRSAAPSGLISAINICVFSGIPESDPPVI